MAPVKRSTTTAQRETRATRAATVAKKKATVSEKTETVPKKKPTAVSTKAPTTTKRGRGKTEEESTEDPAVEDEPEQPTEASEAVKPTRATRANPKPVAALTVAPRRRLKVTPLDAPAVETKTTKEATKSIKATKKESATAKKASTRSKSARTEPTEEVVDEPTETENLKTRTTSRTASKTKVLNEEKTAPATKTRGRPKSQKIETVESEAVEPDAMPTTRTTRSKRANSVAIADAAEVLEAQPPKVTAGSRKKVTFQDLPSENDKENLPLPQSKAKKSTTVKGKAAPAVAATGLRAKPLRKPVATGTATRGRRAAAASTNQSGKVSDREETQEKKMPRALTPKKITQIAKSSSPELDETEMSDDDDVLNGAKTPVRDLSVSPRRPSTSAIARALSPAKKLDSGPSLIPKSPDRMGIFQGSAMEPSGALASPARRPAASPYKDSMKGSPRRGLDEGAKLLFPQSHNEVTASIMLNAPSAIPQAMPTMLQSPKRSGILDPNFFSQSAMKKSTSKSPFKASLLGSPAKRLFSPAKRNSKLDVPQITEVQEGHCDKGTVDEMEVESDVFASSHFRSSSSPLRVHRMELEALDMDFDESVLQIGSPLKLRQTTSKTPTRPTTEVVMEVEDSAQETPAMRRGLEGEDQEVVAPSDLDVGANSYLPSEDNTVNEHDVHTLEAPAEDETLVGRGDLNVEQPASEPRPAYTSTRRTSVNQILFRSTDPASDDDTSEDELAGDKTPVKVLGDKTDSSVVNARIRSRLSAGIPSSVSGKGFGFTPLAAQVTGWLASSPEKTPAKTPAMSERRQSTEFSPLAGQHIEGEVVVSRNSTPVQKLSTQLFNQSTSSTMPVSNNRKSLNLRKSLAQRQSMSVSSIYGSPARNPQFEEYMEIRALEEQADAENQYTDVELVQTGQDFDQIMNVENVKSDLDGEGSDTILVTEDDVAGATPSESDGDLTTDLVNFTKASDTAMVDFQQLAQEAENLASDVAENNEDTQSKQLENSQTQVTVEEVPELINAVGTLEEQEFEALAFGLHEEGTPNTQSPNDELVIGKAPSPMLQPTQADLESPSVLVIDHSVSAVASPSPSSVTHSTAESPLQRSPMLTPKPNLRLNEHRVINTVVSKVPLKPEGIVSPIKITKKRSRSFGNTDASPAKRISFEDLRNLPPNEPTVTAISPDRRVRTSTAPSPGGTSTPATARSNINRTSMGGFSAVTTPGQMSFAIDDFGESTLDGIELPEDFQQELSSADELETPARRGHTVGYESTLTTPKSALAATPATSKQSSRRATTPATASKKKTPSTTRKASGRASTNTITERTPLRPVGHGILHGATVYVDVHTSEGADASGIFIELLTQMGAKCVKEWRWNPRASLAPDAENETSDQKVGITHVVYKDGGKRTLEKVRDAKGEVCCVGVAWVLDCEREQKWLDESNYMIDPSIIPRGGSNRRKSMEPRALLVGNDGLVSASRSRRSVSAEMNELMKRELVNTPARGRTPSASSTNQVNEDDDNFDDEDDENFGQSTPTGFVSYDPRTAMTPGTPYLVSQGKKLTQMSAPPKQSNKSLFEDEDQENDDTFMGVTEENGNPSVVKDAKKFRMKNLGDMAKRRRTLGFKPVIGSPLSRH